MTIHIMKSVNDQSIQNIKKKECKFIKHKLYVRKISLYSSDDRFKCGTLELNWLVLTKF